MTYTSCLDFDGYLELIYKECGLGTGELIKKVQTDDYKCTGEPAICSVTMNFAEK